MRRGVTGNNKVTCTHAYMHAHMYVHAHMYAHAFTHAYASTHAHAAPSLYYSLVEEDVAPGEVACFPAPALLQRHKVSAHGEI